MVHAFAFQDKYIALDSGSGSIHVLDRIAFEALSRLEEGTEPETVRQELVRRYGAEGAEVLTEIEELRRQDLLLSSELDVEMEVPDQQIIKALCLHVAHDCDLRCRYCFASTGSFHGGRSLMGLEVGQKALEFLMEKSGGRKHLEVDFFGGEPLMNLDVVKELVAYGRQLERKYDKVIRFTLTTNCMKMDDETAEYLNREMNNVVLSLDGRREVNDHMRPTREGGSSYETVVENALRFVKIRGDKSYYVRGTYTANNLDFASDVLHMADLGFDQLSVEPVVSPDSAPYALKSEHLPRILAEYDRLAAEMLKRKKAGQCFNFFHFMVDLEGGPCLRKRLGGCGAGCEYVAVTPDGDIYPCHQFVGETEFRLGSVLDGTLDTAKTLPFRRNHVMDRAECQSCWAKYFCGGGCAANAWHKNNDITRPYTLECAMERKRLECAIGLYVEGKNDQAAAEEA